MSFTESPELLPQHEVGAFVTFEAYPFFVAGVHDAVAGSLRDGTPPPVDPGDAVAVLEVLEAARNTSS